MSILSLFGGGRAKAPEYPSDTLTARDGTQFTIRFFSHASLAVSVGEKYLYVDPVSGHAAYASLPKADVLLITHSHYDHLDRAAAEELLTPDTEILCDRTSAEMFEMNCHTMRPGSVATPCDWLKVEAVAAYNTTPDRRQFHPRDREDCGYVLTIGGTRIYIAGDTVWHPEVEAEIQKHKPGTIVLNTGGASLETDVNRISYPWVKADPEIIMNKEDVEKAYKVAPQAKIITVHMDAINHMTVTRKDMKKFVEEKGLGSRVHIPQDGEVIVTGSGKN